MIVKDGCLIGVITVVLIFTLEGLASFIVLGTRLNTIRITAERLHTEYDQLLGWINKRNIYIPDMYGPGVYLKTNALRFRNNRDFDPVTFQLKVGSDLINAGANLPHVRLDHYLGSRPLKAGEDMTDIGACEF